MKPRFIALGLSLSLLLAGCSGSGKPSDSDVEAIVRKELKSELLSYLGSMLNPQAKIQIDERIAAVTIVVGDKNKQADGSYTAIYTVRPPTAYPGFLTTFHISENGTVHILKGADGWVLTKDSPPLRSEDQ